MLTAAELNIIRHQIADVLRQVPDPEIPGISIVELGMVLDILEKDDHWEVNLAPTYSGCPAIDVIPGMVRSKLDEAGYEDVRITMVISPPWSTDWISEEGKDKLLSFGISPPNGSTSMNEHDGRPKHCPQCGSTHTILISRYGSTPCKASYKCGDCLEPFEYFKCF